MAKASRKDNPNNSDYTTPVITTSAEVLPDGSIIEMVRSADGERLELLHWNGETAHIAAEIQHAGRTYRAPEVHESIRRAIQFPGGVADYGGAGTLLQQVANPYEQHLALSSTDAFQIACWNVTTWFADFLPSPPPLIVSGFDRTNVMKLFRLLRCTSRRGLILAEINHSAFRSLPMDLRPTLLVAEPDLPGRT